MNVRKQVPEQRGAVVLARLGGALQETPPELGRHGDLYAPALGGVKGGRVHAQIRGGVCLQDDRSLGLE